MTTCVHRNDGMKHRIVSDIVILMAYRVIFILWYFFLQKCWYFALFVSDPSALIAVSDVNKVSVWETEAEQNF